MNDRERLQAAADEGLLAAALGPCLETAWQEPVCVEAIEVPRVFPRHIGGFTMQYRVFVRRPGSGPEVLLLGGQLLGATEDWPTWAQPQSRGALRVEPVRLAIAIFPADPRLPALPEWADPRRAAALLSQVSGIRIDPASMRSRVLAYRLEKRCVLRHDWDAGGGVVVKLFARRGLEALMQATRAIEACAGPGLVPRTVAVDTRASAHIAEIVPGTSLHDLTDPGEFEAGCAAAGRVLRRLHELPGTGLVASDGGRALERLQGLADALQRVAPEVAASVAEACRELRAPGVPSPARTGLVHGDFYDKQVLYSGARTTVLDWDSAHTGDAAEDHGNFVAHLALRALQMPGRSTPLAAGTRAFEAGYGVPDGAFGARSRWWEAATLARLAGIYALRPRWRHLAGDLMARFHSRLGPALRAAVLLALLGTALPGPARAGRPEYMTLAPAAGKAFEIEVVTDPNGNLRATNLQALSEARSKPSLRAAIQAVDVESRTLTVLGRSVRITDETQVEDPDSVRTRFADLQPGRRVEVTCQVDSGGHWIVKRIRTRQVKASDKLKGTVTKASVDGVPPDTLEIHGMRILLDARTDVPSRLGAFDLDPMLFGALSLEDTRAIPGGVALHDGRTHLSGQVSGDSRMREELDLSDSFVSDERMAQSEFRMQWIGLWTPRVKTFVQARVRTAFALRSELNPGARSTEAQLTQAYALLKTQGTPRLALQLGRQDFDEPREWIFDDYKDAVRLHAYGGRHLAVEAAYMPAVQPLKTDVAPWTDWFAMGRWFVNRRSFLAAWTLRRTDTSIRDREPWWVGARYLGRWRGGFARPWVDTALMRGTDRGRDLRAWALDAGVTLQSTRWSIMPAATVGYAVGSGDDSGRDGVDGNFRQTGYQDNYARLGGVAALYYYGALLDPELCNLRIWTAGVSVRPVADSSIDVVYHQYRQDVADGGGLRSNNLVDPPARPVGGNPDLGWGVDLVAVSTPLWQHLRAKWTTTVFNPGPAFGPRQETASMHRFELTANY